MTKLVDILGSSAFIISQPSSEDRTLRYPLPLYNPGSNNYSSWANNGDGWELTDIGVNSLLATTGSFSIEAWVRWDLIPTGSTNNICGIRADTDTPRRQMTFNRSVDGVTSSLNIHAEGLILSSNNFVITNDVWYHFAVSVSSDDSNTVATASFFADGTAIGTASGSLTMDINAGDDLHIQKTSGDLTGLTGYIDEVRFWNITRSLGNIIANKNIQINPATGGLVGYYRFNNDAIDVTGLNPDVITSGTPIFSSSIPFV